MNVKFELRVTKKALESWLQYVRESGYEVTENQKDGDGIVEICYRADIPVLHTSYTPLAVSIKVGEESWKHWIYVRIPLADEANNRVD